MNNKVDFNANAMFVFEKFYKSKQHQYELWTIQVLRIILCYFEI